MKSLCLDVDLIGAEKPAPEDDADAFELGDEMEKQAAMSDDDAISMITDGLLDMDFDSDLLIDDNSTIGGDELIGGPTLTRSDRNASDDLPETSDTDEEEE